MKSSNLFGRLIAVMLVISSYSYQIRAQVSDDLTNPPGLTHRMSEEEVKLKHLIGTDFIITPPPPGPVRNVAEFDRMQAVLIRYPFGISYAVIKEMADDIHVITIVSGTSQQSTVTSNYIANGVNMNNCSFLIAATNTYWTRDYGPWFIFDGNGQPAIVDFPYNRPRPLDNEIPVAMATHLNIGLYGMNVIHTGGNYMTNGMGISASSDLVWTENPSLTPAQINQYFSNYLGIQNYHVVPDPNNTYIDHIDCWGKFLGPDKILIREVPPTHAQYNAIEATATYFSNQISSYGKPFQVFRVNTPNNQPYTNSIILNNKVLVPVMNSSYDNAALSAYQNAMPGYEIVGVAGSWESTDALHCRTMGIADIGMLYIRHIPLTGTQPVLNQYLIQADIKAHSNAALKTDSLYIIYSVNESEWDTITMTAVSGTLYSGNIPVPYPGSQVSYYLSAADFSGRREFHPFIGKPDAHTFTSGAPSYPDMTLGPASVNVTLPVNGSTTETISIQNSGLLPLNFTATVNYTGNSKTVAQVYPIAQNYRTGSVTSSAFTQTSLVKGLPPNEAGWMTFDVSSIPPGSIINSVEFHGYVNSTYYPYWNINPVNNNPLTTSAGALFNDIMAEANAGYYLFRSESSNYSTGWKTHMLGGNATTDLQNALQQGWFAIGIMDRDNSSTYYIHFDGWAEANPPYLIVDYTYSPAFTWLTIDNDIATSGSVSYQGIYNIEVEIDAAGLEAGIYSANIVINTNDPDFPVAVVLVTLEVIEEMEVELSIWLEGAFNGNDMNTVLNQAGLIPLSQPYHTDPWNYTGSESVLSIPNEDVVDWVLIEFRDAEQASAATPATSIRKQAAFLLKDGSVADLDGISNIQISDSFNHQRFIVIWHRNHLGVLSAMPANVENGVISYDFTSGFSAVYGGSLGFKEVSAGFYTLAGGDGNGDGLINAFDKSETWNSLTGKSGYHSGDFNLDGQINNNDKNEFWLMNQTFESQVPD